MTVSRRKGLFVVAAFTAMAACSSLQAADRSVRGSGHTASVTRPVVGVARVAVAGHFDVEIVHGAHSGLTLEGDDNLLSLVETRVDGPASEVTLHIAPVAGIDLVPTQPIRIRVDVDRLDSIDLSGSGSVSANDVRSDHLAVAIGGTGHIDLAHLDAGHLAVSIGGSGAVRVDGRATNLAVRIGGSGRCDAERLSVDEATVSIGGSGRADVDANGRLSVSIAGSGRVRQLGTAVPKVSVVGSGSVERP